MIYAVLGAGVLVGAALAFHFLTNKQGASSTSLVFDEIEALGPAKKEPNGFLAFPYYKDIFLIISKHSKARFSDEKKDLLTKRRKAHKDGNQHEYKEIVKDMI